MPVYDPILAAETDPDQPLKSSLAKRWTDNWIAGFEGAVGAPRIHPLAFGPIAAGDVDICYLVGGSPLTIGSYSSGGSNSGNVNSSFLGELGAHTILNTGVLRIKGTLATLSGSISSPGFRIYQNNSLITTVSGTFSYDLSVTAGDIVHFGCAGSWSTGVSGGNGALGCNNVRISGDALKLWRY